MTMPMTMTVMAVVPVTMVAVALMPMGLMGGTACFQVLLNGNFVKGVGLPFNDGDGVLGAVPETGSKAIAEVVGG